MDNSLQDVGNINHQYIVAGTYEKEKKNEQKMRKLWPVSS